MKVVRDSDLEEAVRILEKGGISDKQEENGGST